MADNATNSDTLTEAYVHAPWMVTKYTYNLFQAGGQVQATKHRFRCYYSPYALYAAHSPACCDPGISDILQVLSQLLICLL